MKTQTSTSNFIARAALVYDFDKTLCTKDMQEYGFISSLGMTSQEFWRKVNHLTDSEEMDGILAYMYLMMEEAQQRNIAVTRQTFLDLGKNIEFFAGLTTLNNFFERTTLYAASLGLELEHYIVSSGIKEIIEGSSIAPYFCKIYASEFLYADETQGNRIVWPKFAVNYTAKTQFLFRINKGVLDLNSQSTQELNRFTPEKERYIPFSNMLYLGDGITDVPCMKLVKSHGGYSIAIFNPAQANSQQLANRLIQEDRVNCIAPADYQKDSVLDTIIQKVLQKIVANEQVHQFISAQNKAELNAL